MVTYNGAWTKELSLMIALGILAAIPGRLGAAMDMFRKMEGIPGEAVATAHAGEIDVLAWTWGTQQSLSAVVLAGLASSGKVSMLDAGFTKWTDCSSPKLMSALALGTRLPKTVLTVSKAGSASFESFEYYFIALSNVVVTGVTPGGPAAEARLNEKVTLAYQQIQVRYVAMAAGGIRRYQRF
jgi:type VI secretion system secreted protein Hcp